MKTLLLDIEGTLGSISFVRDVLFPYARAQLPAFLREHADEPAVAEQIRAAADSAGCAADDLPAVSAALQAWIDADRKLTPLKALQGMIWEAGYAAGDYRAHLYDDAVAALRRWHAAGVPLYIYSSGSVQAQRLFFSHSEAGDLTPLLAGHFDTTIGSKRDVAAYAAIAERLQQPPAALVFLSDLAEELDAASSAGLQTVWVIRAADHAVAPADLAASPHPVLSDLSDPGMDALLD